MRGSAVVWDRDWRRDDMWDGPGEAYCDASGIVRGGSVGDGKLLVARRVVGPGRAGWVASRWGHLSIVKTKDRGNTYAIGFVRPTATRAPTHLFQRTKPPRSKGPRFPALAEDKPRALEDSVSLMGETCVRAN